MDRKSRGHRSVFSACLNDDVVLLNDLLSSGTAPEASALAASRNDSGECALHVCARYGSFRCAEALIACGASVHERDVENWATPLHLACLHGSVGVACLLLASGAQLDDSSEAAVALTRVDRSRFGARALKPPPPDSGAHDKEGLTPSDLLASRFVRGLAGVQAGLEQCRARLGEGSSRTRGAGTAEGGAEAGGDVEGGEGGSPERRRSAGGRRRNRARADSKASAGSGRSAGSRRSTFDETGESGGGELVPGLFTRFASLGGEEDVMHDVDGSPTGVGDRGVLRGIDWASSWPEEDDRPPFIDTSEGRGGTSAMSGVMLSAMSDDPFTSTAPAVVVTPLERSGTQPQPSWRCAVSTWGRSDFQLGYATGAESQLQPRALELDAAAAEGGGSIDPVIIATSAGRYHSLLLTSEGLPLVFGVAQGGRLGIALESSGGKGGAGDAHVQLTPVPIPFFVSSRLTMLAVSAGERHSLAVCADGGVYAWGDNRSGACGVGSPFSGSGGGEALTAGFVSTPRRAEAGLRRFRAVGVAAGPYHSVAVMSDGSAWAWGSNWTGQLGARDVASGGAAALTSRPPLASPAQPTPPHILWLPRKMDATPSTPASGQMPSAGNAPGNSFNLLGGAADARTGGPSTARALAAAAADAFSLLLTSDGVFTCGSGSSAWIRLVFDAAEADTEDATAAYLEAAAAIAPVSAGARSSPAKGKRGGGQDSEPASAPAVPPVHSRAGREAAETLGRWGFHVVSGLISEQASSAPLPRSSPPHGSVLAPLSGGADEGAWMTSAGVGKVGKGKGGPAPVASPTSTPSPAGGPAPVTTAFAALAAYRVPALRSATITAIACGKHHAVALDVQGHVWSWGCRPELLGLGGPAGKPLSSSPAQSSGGTLLQWSRPRRISSLARAGVRITRIAVSNFMSAAVADDGRLYTWGCAAAVERGVLGHGKGAGATLPRRVASLQQVLDVSLAENHTCALCAAFLPPLPPVRPSAHDLAMGMLREPGAELRVELPGAFEECESPALLLRLYGSVLREEVKAARQLADVYSDSGVHVEADDDEEGLGLRLRAARGHVAHVVPSLRSICERAIAAAVSVGSASTLLGFAEDFGALGLAAYCGAVLAANLPASLAHLSVGRGKGRDRDAVIAHGDGLLRWRWIAPRGLAALRARETAVHRQLVLWWKTIKRREYGLLRPTATWRGWRAAAAAGTRAESSVPGGAGVPAALDRVLFEDVTRTRKLLFSGARHAAVEGEDDEELPASPSSPRVGVRNRVRMLSEGGGSVATADGRSDSFVEGGPEGQALSFQAAYDAILAARGGGPAGGRAEAGSDDEEEGEEECAPARGRPAREVPHFLASTLPASAPPAVQVSLDRLAANLAELQCGPGMAGPAASSLLGGGRASQVGSPLPVDAARALVTAVMLTDAATLAKRVRTVRKKLVEATALAVNACGLTEGEGWGGMLPRLDGEQRSKLCRRLEMCAEVFTVSPFLHALTLLMRWVQEHCAEERERLGDASAETASVCASVTALAVAGLSPAALLRGASTVAPPQSQGGGDGQDEGDVQHGASHVEVRAAVIGAMAGAGSAMDVENVRAIVKAGGGALLGDKGGLAALVRDSVVGAGLVMAAGGGLRKAGRTAEGEGQSTAPSPVPSPAKGKGSAAAPAPAPTGRSQTAAPGAHQGPIVVQSLALETSLLAMLQAEGTRPAGVGAVQAFWRAPPAPSSPAAAVPAPCRARAPAPSPPLVPLPPASAPAAPPSALRDILAAQERSAKARTAETMRVGVARVAATIAATRLEDAAAAARAAETARRKVALLVTPSVASGGGGGGGMAGIVREQEAEARRLAAARAGLATRSPFATGSEAVDRTRNAWGLRKQAP